MIWSVSLIDHAAAPASYAGVARIDTDDGHAAHFRFVSDKVSELPEGPVMQAGSLAAAGRDPSADMLEFFKHDSATSAFCGRDDCLRDAVVGVELEPALAAGQLSQSPFCGLGAALLQALPTAREFGANALDIGAAVGFPIAIRRKIDDSEIDAEPIFGLELISLRNVARRGEHPLSADETQVGLAFAERYQSALMLTHRDGNSDAAADGPQRYGCPAIDKSENAIVVGLRREPAEDRGGFTAHLECIGYLGDRTDGSLCGKSKAVAQIAVGKLLQIELAEAPSIKSLRRQPSASGVASLKRFLEHLCLFRIWTEFDRSNQLHALKYR